jgi:hypothetical protein
LFAQRAAAIQFSLRVDWTCLSDRCKRRQLAVLASRKHIADSLLSALKDARRYVRLMSLWQLKTNEHDLVDVGPAIVARACEMVGRDRSVRDDAAAVRRPRRVWARALRLVNYRHLVMKQLLVRLLHRLSAIRRAVFALRL